MIRPFRLWDIALVRSLQNEGMRLDFPEVLIRPQSSLQLALLAHVFHRKVGASTCVLDGYSGQQHLRGFAQVRSRHDPPEMDIVCLAPSVDSTNTASTAWEHLIQYVCEVAGEHGILRLFAKVPENEQAEQVFRDLDFMVYAREDIFHCPSTALWGAVKAPAIGLRTQRPDDEWGVHHLYVHATPPSVQMAEGHLSAGSGHALKSGRRGVGEKEYVLETDGALQGYVALAIGGKGCHVRMVVHPDSWAKSADILAWALAALGKYPPRPVYWSVRQYEKGMQSLLQEHGFEKLTTQTLMVKQLAVRIREPALRLAPALEKRVEAARTRTCANKAR